MDMINQCVCCGANIPEGSWVCSRCRVLEGDNPKINEWIQNNDHKNVEYLGHESQSV